MPHLVQLGISRLSWNKMACKTACQKLLLQLHKVEESASFIVLHYEPEEVNPDQMHQAVQFKSN